MREQRQQAIQLLLAEQAIGTQAQLRRGLLDRGFDVDQSTLSRDLHELGVRKLGGRYVHAAPETPAAVGAAEIDYHNVVSNFLPCGPFLIVVRTTVGQAQPVALWIEAQEDNAVVATLAGDDTIFLATKNSKTQAVALRRLTAWFGDKRER